MFSCLLVPRFPDTGFQAVSRYKKRCVASSGRLRRPVPRRRRRERQPRLPDDPGRQGVCRVVLTRPARKGSVEAAGFAPSMNDVARKCRGRRSPLGAVTTDRPTRYAPGPPQGFADVMHDDPVPPRDECPPTQVGGGRSVRATNERPARVRSRPRARREERGDNSLRTRRPQENMRRARSRRRVSRVRIGAPSHTLRESLLVCSAASLDPRTTACRGGSECGRRRRRLRRRRGRGRRVRPSSYTPSL